MHQLTEELINEYESTLVEAEELFAENEKLYIKALKDQFPLIGFSNFHPIMRSAQRYYYCDFIVSYIDSLGIDAPSEIKKIKKSILNDKRTLKHSLKKGVYDELIEESGADVIKIDNWLSDNAELCISRFAFFDALRLNTRLKYLIREITFLALSMKDKLPVGDHTYIQYPSEFVGTPFFALSTGQAKPMYKVNKKNNSLDFYFENQNDDGQFVKVIVGRTMIPEAVTEEYIAAAAEQFVKLKAFGPFDFEVFVAILNLITPSVVADGFLVCSLDLLMHRLKEEAQNDATSRQKADRKSHFIDKFENSLRKFRDYDVEISKTTSAGRRIRGAEAYNLFITGYNINQEPYINKVKIDFSGDFLTKWMDSRTQKVMMLYDSWNLISNSARRFAFYLQSLRVLSFDNDYISSVTLTKIESMFPGKRRDFLTADLKEAFKEFKENKILLDAYEIKSGTIDFKFLPLTEEEQTVYKLNIKTEKNEKN